MGTPNFKDSYATILHNQNEDLCEIGSIQSWPYVRW